MQMFQSRSADSFEFQDIRYEKREHVARITINRPERYNAYSTLALEELATAFRDASFDDAVGVIVFTGAGHASFCTGGDVKEYANAYVSRPRDYWKYMGLFKAYIESILNSGKPTIARLNGMAVGGGNESQLACDLGVAAEHAYLKQVGVHVGSVACGGATQWLPLVVGDRRARQMLMLGDAIPARRALEWGLVNEVAPSVTRAGKFVSDPSSEEMRLAVAGRDDYGIDLSKLDAAVDALCARLLETFPECMRYTKQQTNFWRDFSFHLTVGHARDWLSLHSGSPEVYEGFQAFRERRGVDYLGLRQRAAEGGSSEFLWGPPRRGCAACGAGGIPDGFTFCGNCGAKL